MNLHQSDGTLLGFRLLDFIYLLVVDGKNNSFMPPKGRPRGRQSARNTRGAASNSESAQVLSAPSPKEPLATDEGVVDDTTIEVDHAITPVTQNEDTTPQHGMIQDLAPSEIPTPARGITPGSPPAARRSVQRLASVLPRGLSNTTSSSAGADGSEPRLASLKFKPKSNARRSKEEREAFERAEAERLAARQAAGDESGAADRGGFYGRGRGHGHADMNRWKNERFNLSGEASGHLGGATIREGTPRRGRGGWGGIGGGHESRAGGGGAAGAPLDSSNPRLKNEPRVKPEKDKDGDIVMTSSTSNSKPKRAKVKREIQGATYVSSEGELDSDGGNRKKKNIERINLISSDEDDEEEEVFQSEVAKGKQRERTPHIPTNLLRPVRIQRQEHVERSVGVNTDASSLTSAELRKKTIERHETGGSLFRTDDEVEILPTAKPKTRRKPKDVEFVRDERKWKGVYQDEDDKHPPVKVKDEPIEDDEMMGMEAPVSSKEPKDDDNAMVLDTPIPHGDPGPMAIDEEGSGVPLHRALQEPTVKSSENNKRSEPLDRSARAPDDESLPSPDERPLSTGGYIGPEVVYSPEEDEQFLAELDAILAVQGGFQEEASASNAAGPSSRIHEAEDAGDIHIDNKAEPIFLDDEEGRCGYVFQLPPIIPSLRDVAKKPTSPKLEKKTTTTTPKPSTTTSQPTSAAPNNPFNTHPKDSASIKSDPDAPAEPAYPNAYIAGTLNAPGGQAGVLNIYSKGSMRVYWGGMGFEISKGESGSMIPQEVVMTRFERSFTKVEEDGGRWEDRVDVGEKGWAMGQTGKGWVCVPEWGGLLS